MINKVRMVQKLIAGRLWVELAVYIVCDFLTYYFTKRKQSDDILEEEERPIRRKRKATRKRIKKLKEESEQK